jgi:hypothetical protein
MPLEEAGFGGGCDGFSSGGGDGGSAGGGDGVDISTIIIRRTIISTSIIDVIIIIITILKIVPLLDVHQLLMLSARTLTYLEPGKFSSVILYNML